MIKTLIVLLTISICAHAKKVEVIFLEYPPLSYDKESPKGVLVELIKAAAEEANIDIDIDFYPPKRAIALFEEKKDSFIVSTFKALDRKEITMVPLLKVYAGYFGKVDKSKVKKVAYMAGLKPVREIILKKGLSPFPVPSYPAGLKAVESGRVERFLGVNTVMNHYMAELKLNGIKMKEGPMYIENVGLIGKNTSQELIQLMVKGIKKIKKDKTYQAIAKKYLSPDIGVIKLEDYFVQSFSPVRRPQSSGQLYGLE